MMGGKNLQLLLCLVWASRVRRTGSSVAAAANNTGQDPQKIFCQQQTLHIEDLHRKKPKDQQRHSGGKLKKVNERAQTQYTHTTVQHFVPL